MIWSTLERETRYQKFVRRYPAISSVSSTSRYALYLKIIARFCRSPLGRLLVGTKRFHTRMLVSASFNVSWYHSMAYKELLGRKVSSGRLADIPWNTELILVPYGAAVNYFEDQAQQRWSGA